MNERASEREAEWVELLVFEVGSQRYALRSTDVAEVVRAVTIVSLPHAPATIEGIIDVRGTVVPVFDIRTRFRLAPKPLAIADHLVLAWAGPRLVALRVDQALDLVSVPALSVEAGTGATDYVAGVARLDDGLVLIHDLRTFLSGAESAALDDALDTEVGAGP